MEGDVKPKRIVSRRQAIQAALLGGTAALLLAACGPQETPQPPPPETATPNKNRLYKKFTSSESGQPAINPEAVNAKGWETIYDKIHIQVERFHERSPEKDTKPLDEYEEEFYDKVRGACSLMGVDFSVCLKLISKAPGDSGNDALIERIRKSDFLGFMADKTNIITPMQAIRLFSGNPTSGLLDKEQIIHARIAEAYPTEMESQLAKYPDVAKSWTDLIEARNAQDKLQTDLQDAIDGYFQQYPNSLDFFWDETSVYSNFEKLGIDQTVSSEQTLNYGVAWLKWSELYDKDKDSPKLFENVADETKAFLTSSDNRNRALFEDQILKNKTIVEMVGGRAETDDEKQLLDQILKLRDDYLEQTRKFKSADDKAYDKEHLYDDNPDYQIGLSVALVKHYSRVTQDKFSFSIDSSKPETVWSAIYMNMIIAEVSSASILASRKLSTPSHAQYDWEQTLSSLSSLIDMIGFNPLSSKDTFLLFYLNLRQLNSGTSPNPATQELYNRLAIPSGSTGWHFALEAINELYLLSP